jgi:BirA family transcriptional regulator, biotin operon repressor / biotin---[acetyl-CoA-carboxylase] ligase
MDENTLRAALAGLPVNALRYFATIGSTNAEALDWAAEGAPDGTLVVADAQSAGRGRLGRQWVTSPSSALAVSLILRLQPQEVTHAALFSPLGALAVCEVLTRVYGLDAEIKWPNDVLLSGKKVCGVLAEAGVEGSVLDHVVLGIGVNVTHTSTPPTDDVRFPAVCVEEVLGRTVDRTALLTAILRAVFAWRVRVGEPDFIEELNSRLAFRGQQVRIVRSTMNDEQPALTGQMVGIAQDGSLILKGDDGVRQVVTAGDVSLRLSGDRES